MRDLNILLQQRLFELTHYERPSVIGDRRHMAQIDSTSPLDKPDGPETREGLICNIVKMGFTPNKRPNLQSFSDAVVSILVV